MYLKVLMEIASVSMLVLAVGAVVLATGMLAVFMYQELIQIVRSRREDYLFSSKNLHK